MRKLRPLILIVVLFAAGWTAFAPTRCEPVAWTAPKAPEAKGVWAPNGRLAKVEWLARDRDVGPEAIAIDPQGNIVTGYLDGRVVRLSRDGLKFDELAMTGGRPLGVSFDAAGLLYLCDAHKGLLRLRDGKLETLAAGHQGKPFVFADDLDIAPDGTVYFSDASAKFSFEEYELDLLEHAGTGRLLAWHPSTGQTEVLLDGLQFANGVALGKDAQFVVVNETGSYRVTRYWLSGPKKGQHDVFVSDLPGFPDNITYSKAKDRFWVALASPRDSAVDALARFPFIRKAVARLPAFLRPKPVRHAQIVALDGEGRVVDYLDDDASNSYSPVTSVRESDGFLYLGSLSREAIGRIAAP